ncbi:succinyl-CoA synthetase alpha subunit [Paucidesulfovibrio gracilis DSM 16080]|jgi:succinyl-CoA synthetase alpha subunit|uniref:Succinate--CoA ligase [ADP-forming] subunit alpha n=1 Tax=Paucidesulfovibrio gracilis DSM 16080 TaxID=1121449 RepID=A0A1T4XIW9_9BACT|nr:succinate--CoA ligase subunit alpha [Paucidesulfovibrio gracilis]SKA89426.1 succinyl-CoA synthetase alpha subunit [Paucidesulfovibrio gracilis DSM 16080]
MSILVNENTRVIVQGLTGREGSFHGQKMLDYGTNIVAGVTPGKGGQEALGLPVYNTMKEAVDATGADTSIIFVPAGASADSACEAAEAGIKLVILITEHIPVLDMVRCKAFLKERGTMLIGPNCPGVISPGKCKIGIMPDYIHRPGTVGLISRSGTLTYEAVHQLTSAGLGQSTCIGIGGDPVPGLKFIDLLEMFRNDPDTEAVCMLGEIGGDNEEKAAAYIKETNYPKPVFGFIAGLTAPAGKRMGHAGAIISGSKGRGEDKIAALEDAGVTVVKELGSLGRTVAEALGK